MLKFNGGAPDKDYFQGVNVAHFNPIKNGDDTFEEFLNGLSQKIMTIK